MTAPALSCSQIKQRREHDGHSCLAGGSIISFTGLNTLPRISGSKVFRIQSSSAPKFSGSIVFRVHSFPDPKYFGSKIYGSKWSIQAKNLEYTKINNFHVHTLLKVRDISPVPSFSSFSSLSSFSLLESS